LPEETAEFRPVHNTETHMSTGSRDLDALLGGGVARGSTVLLEMRGDVPFEAQVYVPLTALLNFLATGNAVMMFPYSVFDPKRSRPFATQFMAEDLYDANMRAVATGGGEDRVAIRLSSGLATDVANLSQIHLVMTTRCGTLVFYGVKPRTGFYGLTFSFANGYPEFKLIPLQDVPLSRERGGMPSEPPLSVPVHIRRRAPQADFFETVARSMQSAKKRLTA